MSIGKTFAITAALAISLAAIVPTLTETVPAAACNIGSENGEPDDVFVNGEGHGTTNDNGRHITCHGTPDNPPTSGGARVDKVDGADSRCTGVATPSGQGNFVCNTNNNRK
jgi:hypothetical protein